MKAIISQLLSKNFSQILPKINSKIKFQTSNYLFKLSTTVPFCETARHSLNIPQ